MRKSAYIITLLAMLLPLGAWALGGSGTSSDPFTIANEDDLFLFANRVNNSAYGDNCFKLVANITLTKAWTPIGTSNKPFTGTFDGNDKTISGLNLTATAANAGFFGYVNGATIKNFTLAGSISSNSDNVGSVVGSADGATKIYNVYSSVNITMTAAKSHIGGIAGQLLQENSKVPEIKGCTYSGTMNLGSSTDSNGGIVGYCEKDANVQIEYCFFHGSISSSGSTPRIGGILGYADDENSQNFNYIRNCFCDGTLSPSTGQYIGIFAGYPRGNVPGVITDNTYVSSASTNMLGNGYNSTAVNKGNTPITISVTAGSNGTVSHSYVNPTSTTATQLQVVANPNAHYHLNKWSDNGAQTHNVGLTANVSLSASFAIDQHTITAQANNNNYGTVSGGGTFDYNSTKTITATPKEHYHFVQWNDGNTNASRTITVTGDKTYTATFAIDQFTITVKTNDSSMGTVSGGGTFDYNSTKTITATPKAGYHFVKWSDGNTNASRSVTVSANATYTATFEAHTYGDWITDTPATCTTTGTKHHVCTKTGCGASENGTIAVLGHDFTSQTATTTYRKSAATCTADAVYYHKCSRCAEKGTSTWTNTGTATGHGHTKGYTPTYTWSDDINVHTCSFTLKCLDCNAYVVNTTLTGTQTAHDDPTCTADGSTTYKVTGSYSVTGSKSYSNNNSKTYTIAALGHDMTEYAHVDATCTTDGMDAYWTCSRCADKLFKDENGTEEWNEMPVLAALGHDISNNQCSRCDLKAKAVFANNTLTFYFDDIEHDGTTYSLNTGASDPGWYEKRGDISTVVFDSSFGSARPTTCYKWFYNSQWLSKITGLEYLNTEEVTNMYSMFYNCRFLRSLDLSGFNTSKVSDMGLMFNSCISLQSLDLSSFNTSITTTMNVMFAYCNTLESLTIGNFDMSLVTSSGDMFYDCNNLKTLTMKSIPFLKEGTFDTWFSGAGNTVNLLLDDNSAIYEGNNYLPTITNCNHYNQTTPVHVDATCTEDGYDGKTCSYCHTDFDKTINNPALGHTEVIDNAVAATCTTSGLTEGKHCSVCETVFVAQEVIAALGHTFAAEDHSESVCTVCNHGFFRYTSGNGEVVTPSLSNHLLGADGVQANIVSNTYANGQGVIEFDKPLVTIGEGAFSGCDFTGDLAIPNSVTTIGIGAFFFCYSINGTLTLGSSIKTIGDNAFQQCGFTGNLVIPNSVTTIGEYAFNNCTGFNGTLTLGSSVETIGNSAFFNCNSFTGDLTIPNSVTTIGNNAFDSCSGFNGTLTLGSSVQTIGEGAFFNCDSFTGDLTIPNSVTTIGEYVFNNCSGFKGTLTLGSSVETIGAGAFQQCGFTGNLVIPNSVTTIGEYVFKNCSGFNGTLTLGSSVQTIGEGAFVNCDNFTGDLVIPNSVTTIGAWAFESCTSFNSVELHSIPYTDWSFNGVTDNKTVVLNGNSYVYKEENPGFPEVLSVTAPCTLNLTGSVVENHANLTINHSFGTTMTAAPVEDGLYAYVCDNDCGGHSGDHFIKDFNGTGNHLALTKDGEGHYSTTENIEIVDATAFVSPVEFTAQSVEYTRTFGGTNWTTWYVPFDMELTDEICEKMDFSRINNVHQYDDNDDGIADRTIIESFRQKAGVTLKANYPYLVRAKDAGNLNIVLNLSNATVDRAAVNSIVCRSVDYTYTFTGTYTGEGDSGTASDSPYSLCDTYDDNSWYHFHELAPQRHYLTITPRNGGTAPHPARVRLHIVGDEDADGIVSLYGTEQQQTETYDIMGRKISRNSKQPGLRIVNGKIVFTK